MNGIYINLDNSPDRRLAFEQMLLRHGYELASFQRFSAVVPEAHEHERKGLKTKGQLGLWLSLERVLDVAASINSSSHILIMEDDGQLSPRAKVLLNKFSDLMVSDASLEGVDVIFLSYFMTAGLLASLERGGLRIPSPSMHLLPASQYYLACTDCFLVKRSSAAYIAQLFGRMRESGVQLSPVDIALRNLIKLGLVNGRLVFPPVSAPSLELPSTINADTPGELLASQAAHSVLRLVSAELLSPPLGIKKLEGLFGQSSGKPEGGFDDFLSFFNFLSQRFVAW